MAVFGRAAVVANTDNRWFEHFRPSDSFVEIDELNFFRLKHPVSAIADTGFFTVEHKLSIEMPWELFGAKNGDPDRARFERRVAEYRVRLGANLVGPLRCLILRDAVFLPGRNGSAGRRTLRGLRTSSPTRRP